MSEPRAAGAKKGTKHVWKKKVMALCHYCVSGQTHDIHNGKVMVVLIISHFNQRPFILSTIIFCALLYFEAKADSQRP